MGHNPRVLQRLLTPRARQRAGGPRAPLCLLGTALALLAVVCLPAPPLRVSFQPDRPPAGALPWLSVSGGRIVDGLGRTVLLRGFNDDALLQVGGQAAAPPLSAGDASLMRREGFDVVRLPISWSLLEPRPGDFSQAYLRRIRAAVDLCARDHLYVVLDMHTEDFGVAFGGSGAPAWLSVPGVPDLHLPFLPAAWQRHLSPAVNAALAYFWLEPSWQALYWDAWERVAAQFRRDSAVAGYDLYNEPHPLPVPPAIFETQILWPFYSQGIERISRVDPNHLFIVEGDLFGGLPTAVRPLSAPDLVYSTHLYAGSLLPPTYDGSSAPLEAELERGISEAAQLPAAYWAGELGISHQQGDAVSWARAEIALSNRHLTGWAWWEWDDPDDWGVRQGKGPPDQAWLRVLAQPFVAAAPGRLSELSYSVRTRTLEAEVRGARGGAPLVVSWPAYLGTPQVLSACARPELPYRPATGQLSLRLTGADCRLEIRA